MIVIMEYAVEQEKSRMFLTKSRMGVLVEFSEWVGSHYPGREEACLPLRDRDL